ncbi:MAG: hypothetical protein ACRDXX_13710 [Stackebrandtia sp.]
MDTSRLATAAETAASLSSSLSDRSTEVGSASAIPSDMWQGQDAFGASNLLINQQAPLWAASSAFTRGQAALEDLVDGIDAAKEHLQSALDVVSGTGITIGGDGTVTTPVVDSATVAEHNASLAEQARAIIDEALAMAEEADEAAVSAINGESGDDGEGGGEDGDDQSVLEWLNGGWREGMPQPAGPEWMPDWMQRPLFDQLTEEEWERQYGPLTFSSEHGDGDQLNLDATLWGADGPSLNLGGSPQHTLEARLPQQDVGALTASLGSVSLNDSMIPGISWGADEDGRVRLLPRVSAPFVSLETPNISVDLNEVGDNLSEGADSVREITGRIPGTPWG